MNTQIKEVKKDLSPTDVYKTVGFREAAKKGRRAVQEYVKSYEEKLKIARQKGKV